MPIFAPSAGGRASAHKGLGRREFLWMLIGGAIGCAATLAKPRANWADADDISQLLTPIREQFKLPGLAAALAQNGAITAIGAVGVRKRGAPEPMQTSDLFHIGSNTKSMTATLLATLVEEGTLDWHTRVVDVFPDFADSIRPDYAQVDVLSLLSHRSGIPAPQFPRTFELTGPLPDQRRTMVQMLLAQEPADPPGSVYKYSNWGYVVAGAIAERKTGQAWEDLITQRIFEPLGLQSVGFGAPGDPTVVDQPWGHRDAESDAIPPGPRADNPPLIGPAGTVHCSLADFITYATLHARGDNGETGLLLKPDTFQDLHKDWYNQEYALGWVIANRAWAGGRTLNHQGSNTLWYHDAWIAPARDAVVLSATNCGYGGEACDMAVAAMIRRYLI